MTVEVETYRPFFILGEVTTPGQDVYKRQGEAGSITLNDERNERLESGRPTPR